MNPVEFERIIIKFLFEDEHLRDKIYFYLKPDIFNTESYNEIIFIETLKFTEKYERFPTVLEFKTFLKSPDVLKHFIEVILPIDTTEYKSDFLISEIEDFIQDRLLMESAKNLVKAIKDKKGGKVDAGPIQEDISDAMAFSFDDHVGLEFFENPDTIYESLNDKENIVPSDIDELNNKIEGGFHEKSLTLLMAGTNVGKTLAMCSLATGIVLNNRNVLYITFEDSEEKIAQRITFNLLDKSKFQLLAMNKEVFKREFTKAKEKIQNRLIIKEFPEYSANANTIEAFLKELNLKKKFKPDIIFIDYIGCMVPNGKANLNINSNEILRQVAGQTRAIGMRHAIPIVSGTQTTRGGSILSEIDLTDVADSFGQTMKADVIFAMTEPPELASNGMFSFQILKNRFGTKGHKFFVGVDKFKQRLFNVENSSTKPNIDNVVSDMLNNNSNTKKVVLFD